MFNFEKRSSSICKLSDSSDVKDILLPERYEQNVSREDPSFAPLTSRWRTSLETSTFCLYFSSSMSLTPQLSVQSSLSALALTVYICNFYFIVLEHTVFIISEYPFLLYACRKRTSFYKYLWNWGFEGNPI